MSGHLRDLLEDFRAGRLSLDEALGQIRLLSYRAVDDMAKIDPHRADRIEVPEAILAEGKDASDLVSISLAHLEAAGSVIITRVSPEKLALLRAAEIPEGARFTWNERARIVVINARERRPVRGKVGIITAGTADIPVAEEARIIAEEMGCEVVTDYDLGVAGIHRLFPSLERFMEVDALVVAAGREGTLPAVVSALVEAPVIGLPVSTGYGMGGGGRAALLSMLQSCSVLAVVNIDAGFVAGAFAAKIAIRRAR